MADTFLSLDIDTYGIDAMMVKQVAKKFYIKEICHVKFEDLPETDPPQDLFEAAMMYINDHMDLASCSAATLLIPASSVSFRNIELPFTSARKIKQILPIEIASHLPAPEEKYISDFHVLNIPYQEGQVPVFTASVFESDIENYIGSSLKYGITPKIITPKGYATAIGILKENLSVTNFICLDLGVHEDTITLVYNREPVFVRAFPASQYKDEALAESVKQVLLGFRQTLGINTCFDLFVTAANEFKGFEKLYYGLENLLHYQTKFNPSGEAPRHKPELKKIDSHSLISTLHPHQKTGSLFNFYSVITRSDTIVQKNIKAIATSVFLACLLFALYFYNFHMEITDLNARIANNKNSADLIYKTSFPDEKNVRYPLLQMQSRVKKVLKESNSMETSEQGSERSIHKAAHVIAVLSDSIPKTIDMEISKFFLNQTTLVISGTTDNFKNVDRIKSSLEKTALFKQISIDTAAADKKTDQVLFKFTIQMSKGAS